MTVGEWKEDFMAFINELNLPRDDYRGIMKYIADGYALLKEQETIFEKDGHHIMCKSCGAYFCDIDREGDRYPQNFCPNCGKAVKQND